MLTVQSKLQHDRNNLHSCMNYTFAYASDPIDRNPAALWESNPGWLAPEFVIEHRAMLIESKVMKCKHERHI